MYAYFVVGVHSPSVFPSVLLSTLYKLGKNVPKGISFHKTHVYEPSEAFVAYL